MDFKKNFITYDENAIIQKQVAENLAEFISKKIEYKNIKKVLELGCGTGLFTREILKKIKIEEMDLNDLFDTKNYFLDIKYRDFICKDMEKIDFKKYDIIISSSSFQWINDLEKLIRNISKSSQQLAFSIYIEGNLIEIYEHFKVGLNYKTNIEVIDILKKYFKNIDYFTEEKILNFNNPMLALKHLKTTGVTLKNKTSILEIKSYKSKKLTYKISYFFAYN